MKKLYFPRNNEILLDETYILTHAFLQAAIVGSHPFYCTPETIHATLHHNAQLTTKQKKDYLRVLETLEYAHQVRGSVYCIMPDEIYNIDYENHFILIDVDEF